MKNKTKLSDEQTKQVSGGADAGQEVKCPACGSNNLREIKKPRPRVELFL